MLFKSLSAGTLLKRATPLAALLLASASLYAQQPMSIVLNGATEVPPVTSTASGTGQITLLPDHTLSGSIKVSGMTPTMAHIHEAAAGKNGPPIITLSKMSNDSFVLPPNTKLNSAQYTSYMAGYLYVNVHSVLHPEGEIRAQLPHISAMEISPLRSER